uniref:Uncharacterized protein n=1 Tax=Leersia perrieri TaxID=77586 RepID=A0A0D9XBE1_9ORYZ
MHEEFWGIWRLTVQLKGVGEVHGAATALEMPGNTTNEMATRERLDQRRRNKANESRSGLRNKASTLFGEGKMSGAHRTWRNKANGSRSGLRKKARVLHVWSADGADS